MGDRNDYEHLELDYDSRFHYFMNADVCTPWRVAELYEFCKYWQTYKVKEGLYWKGTRLYFTFKGVKYFVSWVFYDETYIQGGIDILKRLGASNIQINFGVLD